MMREYQITFTARDHAEFEDTRVVCTDLDPESDEFSKFIAEEARTMGREDLIFYFENEIYRNHPPEIDVIQLAGGSFSPDSVVKYWLEKF